MRFFYFIQFAMLLTACFSCSHIRPIILNDEQIVIGIAEGAQALPYLMNAKASVQELNNAFKRSGVPITLEDTYLGAYQYALADIPEDGNTGQAFSNMQTATGFLQKILKSQKIPNAEHYQITAMGTPNENGFILMAAVFRPATSIHVFNKFDFLLRQTLTAEDIEFFRAYRTDVSGNTLDTVYDWVALPVACISSQKKQALLLTLMANTIIKQQTYSDYWKKERHWIAGNYLSVMAKQDYTVCRSLGLETCFYEQLND